jgi:hypothetical protein
MPAGSTYTRIQSYTLGSNTTVTFSSIPQTYTDLILVGEATGTTNGAMDVRFNGDTGSNYSRTGMYGDGSTDASYRSANLPYGLIGAGAGSARTISVTHFMNYSNTSQNKVYMTFDYSTGATGAAIYLWRSNSAITTIALTGDPIGSNIGSSSTFTLYGIASA